MNHDPHDERRAAHQPPERPREPPRPVAVVDRREEDAVPEGSRPEPSRYPGLAGDVYGR